MSLFVSYIGDFMSFIALQVVNLPHRRPFRSASGITGAVLGAILCALVLLGSLFVDYHFILAAVLTACIMVLIIPYYRICTKMTLGDS
jgi:amino acid permease